jgi:hypothetical protein
MFHDVPEDQRLRLLMDNCDSRDETTYMKTLTAEELDIKRETLAENMITFYGLEEDFKKVKDEFKDKMDPIKDENREICQQVKTGKEEVKGILFHFADHEDSVMNTYDERGEFVSSRRLRPDEKQGKLFIAHGRTADESPI